MNFGTRIYVSLRMNWNSDWPGSATCSARLLLSGFFSLTCDVGLVHVHILRIIQFCYLSLNLVTLHNVWRLKHFVKLVQSLSNYSLAKLLAQICPVLEKIEFKTYAGRKKKTYTTPFDRSHWKSRATKLPCRALHMNTHLCRLSSFLKTVNVTSVPRTFSFRRPLLTDGYIKNSYTLPVRIGTWGLFSLITQMGKWVLQCYKESKWPWEKLIKAYK